MAARLICNQQAAGSSPAFSSDANGFGSNAKTVGEHHFSLLIYNNDSWKDSGVAKRKDA